MPLAVHGVQVHLVDRGPRSGSPVLFLHGVPDSADLWDDIMRRLEPQHRCLAPDLPGLGRSVAPADFDLSLDNMARFVDGLLAAAGVDTPVNLAVTDFGGPYGLAWAVAHPRKVRRIAIVGGVAFTPDLRWHRNARLLRLPVLGELAMATMTRPGFVRTMRTAAPALDRDHWDHTYELSMARPAVRRMILRLYRALDPQVFAGWDERLVALTADVPTLVLWGDQDPFIAPAYAERFGAARVEHFPDRGHWLAVEAPDIVADRLAAFFA